VSALITKAGTIAIHADAPGQVGVSIPHSTHLHQKTTAHIPSGPRALKLHTNPAIREAELAAPIFSIVDGMNFGLIRLSTLEELSLVYPGKSAFSIGNDLLDAGWKNTYMARYYYVVLSSSSVSSQSRDVSLRTRMMENNFEDPATGAAAGALSSYYALYQCEETELNVRITQGVEFGRESDINVYIAVDINSDGKRVIKEVRLGGTATQIIKGSVTVPPL
jgi:predicted PhzF superfamily epimerase YddE/YHI9